MWKREVKKGPRVHQNLEDPGRKSTLTNFNYIVIYIELQKGAPFKGMPLPRDTLWPQMSLEGQAQADISVVSCQELGRAWLLCYGREAPACFSLGPFDLLELHTSCFTGSPCRTDQEELKQSTPPLSVSVCSPGGWRC